MAGKFRSLAPRCSLSALALALAACSSSIPHYEAPHLDVPLQFKEGPQFQAEEAKLFQPADFNAQVVSQAWWELFNDPVLNDLQQRAEKGNASLASSAAAVKLAQAATQSAQSALWPSIGLTGGLSKSNVQTATNPKGTTYSVQGALSSWEVDLWDRLGATVSSNKYKEQASVADLAAARLSVQASIAQTYFSIRAAEVLGKGLSAIVQDNKKFVTLTQNQYAAGVASAATVESAKSQLLASQGQLEEALITRATSEHALATLLGVAPAALNLQQTAVLPPIPRVRLQVPSQLLERRPDIAAAERTIAAANAAIGAADAAFFPALTLSASDGFRNNLLDGLLALPNRFWSLGPSLAYALFDGGARKAASASARASYDQAVANYKQTVLTALQEVEDNLVTAAGLQREEADDQASFESAHKATQFNQNQYEAGVVSYLNVITARNAEMSAFSSLTSVQSRRLTALAILLKNLGGTWEGASANQEPAKKNAFMEWIDNMGRPWNNTNGSVPSAKR